MRTFAGMDVVRYSWDRPLDGFAEWLAAVRELPGDGRQRTVQQLRRYVWATGSSGLA
jgi:hypothetical protein